MTGGKRLEKKLAALLQQAEITRQTAEREIAYIRDLLKTIEDGTKRENCRHQLRHLKSLVRSCKSDAGALRELLRRVRGEILDKGKGTTPPPTTIRVSVPKGLHVSDDVIKQLILQTLNKYAQATEP